MPVQAITGLPGSGKSCFAMHLMYTMFLDWARYEHKHGKPFERKLYTNIPLRIKKINETASKALGWEVDLTDQIIPLKEDFFLQDGQPWAWWESFAEGSFVIVDEVQNLLPAQQNSDKAAKELRKNFMQYVSMHRHKQQDLIFMSQSISNVTTDIRKMISQIFDVVNIKDQKLGPFWPYQIPMSDIDVVKESWGYSTQFAHIMRGRQEGNRFRYDKNAEMFLMTPFLFDMYKSHTKSEATTDRPSLKLGKIGSLLWLARRHGIRIGLATVILGYSIYAGWSTLRNMPTIVMETLKTAGPTIGQVEQTGTTSGDIPVTTAPVSVPTTPPPLGERIVEDDTVTGLIRDGVITPRGVLRKGDEFVIDGKKDKIGAVNFGKGIVYLGSGKRVYK
jgi:hypothetical protein